MKARDMDELLGTTARLAIVLTLSDGQDWPFTALREATGLADGNLHVQTGKLKAAGYVVAEKVQKGNRRVTTFRLTEHGRRQLGALARRLGQAVGLTGGGMTDGSGPARTSPRTRRDDSQVW